MFNYFSLILTGRDSTVQGFTGFG